MENDEDGRIIVTPLDLWNKLEEVSKRVANLERFRWAAMGGGTVLGALFGTFGAYLTNYVLNGPHP